MPCINLSSLHHCLCWRHFTFAPTSHLVWLLQITWLNDTNYVNVQVDMEDKGVWDLSFPKDPDSLTRFLCTSSSGKCLIDPQTACTPDSAALKGEEVETMSIVEDTSACSAGSAAASVGGASLTYGLKVQNPTNTLFLLSQTVLCLVVCRSYCAWSVCVSILAAVIQNFLMFGLSTKRRQS